MRGAVSFNGRWIAVQSDKENVLFSSDGSNRIDLPGGPGQWAPDSNDYYVSAGGSLRLLEVETGKTIDQVCDEMATGINDGGGAAAACETN